MSTIEKKLGRRIARQRKAVGFTQAQLAEKVGVELETISRIETGRRTAFASRLSVAEVELVMAVGEGW